MRRVASQPLGRSAMGPAKAMRPSVAATAPVSMTPSPGRPGASVASRASSQIVSNRIYTSRAGEQPADPLYIFARRRLLSSRDPKWEQREVPRELFFDHALLPSGWARDVRITVSDGAITAVQPGATRAGAEHVAGIAVPGLPNLHSHAFQRGMAGLAERRGPTDDSFWTWREVMYRFLARLTPDDVEAIAAFAYMEMLEAGFTTVGEFHYLHHDIDGSPYADLGEMAARIAAASATTGIGLTLLPSFYAYGGFGGAPATAGQRRFINDPDRFVRLLERTRAVVAALPAARVGIAPHSLRAVTPDSLRLVCEAAPGGPIHIHAAEQSKEVEESIAVLGQRPVQWLLDHIGIDARWCVVHATHTTEQEIGALAASGAEAGRVPPPDESLRDGAAQATE